MPPARIFLDIISPEKLAFCSAGGRERMLLISGFDDNHESRSIRPVEKSNEKCKTKDLYFREYLFVRDILHTFK